MVFVFCRRRGTIGSLNQYTLPIVKLMSNHELINCELRVRVNISSAGKYIYIYIYIYVIKDVVWVLPYMNQEPGHLSDTDPMYMYNTIKMRGFQAVQSSDQPLVM